LQVPSGNHLAQSRSMNATAEIRCTPPDSRTELDPLFEKAPLALAQFQRSGQITAFNSAMERMLGGRLEVSQPRYFGDLIDAKDRAEGERLIAELFERQRDSFQIDSQSVEASSSPVHWTVWRVQGTGGHPDAALALAENVSRNHEAEQRLRQAERLEAVGRLAGGVAHDFNNLLTGVLLYCDLLLAHIEPCHRVRKYAEEIRKAGLQATSLVRQLLAVARPGNSEPRLLSLNEIAEGMRNLLVRLIGENIELKFQLDPNLGLVKMDPTQCQQILLNLALNARDAMPDGGEITVETSNCKVQVLPEPRAGAGSAASLPCALFVVADNGEGMDDATRAHLFEAFFTTKVGKGTGLGLATVHDIVTSNGGLIHVDSAPQRGTRVSVLLPLIPVTVLNAEGTQDFYPETKREVLIPR
jgi:two-component system cell cycle sensor histidine kinase/response regulator CckA